MLDEEREIGRQILALPATTPAGSPTIERSAKKSPLWDVMVKVRAVELLDVDEGECDLGHWGSLVADIRALADPTLAA